MKTLTTKSVVMSLAHTLTRQGLKSSGLTYRALFALMLKKAWLMQATVITPEVITLGTSGVTITPQKCVVVASTGNHAQDYLNLLAQAKEEGFMPIESLSSADIRRGMEGLNFYARRTHQLLNSNRIVKFSLGSRSYYFFK